MRQSPAAKARRALESARRRLAGLRPRLRKPGRREILTILIILGLLSLTSLMAIVYVPEANIFCKTCHNMEPFMEGIEDTSHGGFNCHACHSLGPEVVKELYVQAVHHPSPEEILEEAGPRVNLYKPCLECHDREALLELEIHRSHWPIVEKVTGGCDTCHHPHFPDQLPYSCNNCHQLTDVVESHSRFHQLAILQGQAEARLTCTDCHSPSATWQVQLSPDCVEGQVLGKSCFDCHPTPLDPPRVEGGSCLECHSG